MTRKVSILLLGLLLGVAEVTLGWSLLAANFLGAFLIFTGLGYCIGGGFFLALGRVAPTRGAVNQSDQTLLFLAPGALLILLAMPLEYLYLPETLSRSRVMQWLGLTILLLGMCLRIWTRQSLRQGYQGNLQVQSGQQLITSGPYHWIRHPGYLAFILLALGLGLGFSSLAGLFGVVLLVVGFLYRIQMEEKMLAQEFGAVYNDYAKHTVRLIPRVW
jgi:protein-S-isoprenylcysteine O-methyltransferase Ste14